MTLNEQDDVTWEDLPKILDMRDRQSAYVLLTMLYINSGAKERAELCNLWPFERTWSHGSAASLTFRIGENFSPKDRIISGLIAYTIAPEVREGDYRDTMAHLAWYYQCLVVVGEDPDAIFRDIARISDSTVATWLTDFADRTPEYKSLKAFCLERYISPNGEVGIRSVPW